MRSLARRVARDLKLGPALLVYTATLWPRMTELFRIINLGSPPLKVATFNGGLFDPERHPFLEQWAVGDARLQRPSTSWRGWAASSSTPGISRSGNLGRFMKAFWSFSFGRFRLRLPGRTYVRNRTLEVIRLAAFGQAS